MFCPSPVYIPMFRLCTILSLIKTQRVTVMLSQQGSDRDHRPRQLEGWDMTHQLPAENVTSHFRRNWQDRPQGHLLELVVTNDCHEKYLWFFINRYPLLKPLDNILFFQINVFRQIMFSTVRYSQTRLCILTSHAFTCIVASEFPVKHWQMKYWHRFIRWTLTIVLSQQLQPLLTCACGQPQSSTCRKTSWLQPWLNLPLVDSHWLSSV